MTSQVIKPSENVIPPILPTLRSKTRILSTVTNKDSKINSQLNNKAALIERQRENASKLSSGRSVVSKADKENEVAFKRPVKAAPKVQQKPTKSLDQKKVSLQKSESSLSIYQQEVMKPKEKITELLIPKNRKVSFNILRSRPASRVVQDKEEKPEVKPEKKEESKVEEKEVEENVPSNVIDVDEDAKNNEYILGIYAKDIYNFLRHLEDVQTVRENYLTTAHNMTKHMRALLVDWMFEVQQSFRLINETIHLSIALLDRFMQDHPSIVKEELQLVAVACIFLASKYEEIFPPDLVDLVDITANTYTKDEILKMERLIFSSLKFQIGRPLPSQFLRRYGRASKVDEITYCFSKYFIDLSLVSYDLCHVPPSLLAAASSYLSLFLTSENPSADIWTPTLVYYSTYSKTTLQPIVSKIASIVLQAPTSKYQTVRKKYLDPKKFYSVSVRTEMVSDRLTQMANERQTCL